MEIKSPIVYKHIDVTNFAENDNEKQNKKLFFDFYSQKIIQINEENIKIFNKKATKLLKKVNINLTQ